MLLQGGLPTPSARVKPENMSFLEVIFNRGVSLCFIFSQKDVFLDAGSLGLTARPSILAASQHCQHPRLSDDVDLTRYLDHT